MTKSIPIQEELEKIEIVTDLVNICTVEQLREIHKCFIPKKGETQSKTLIIKCHVR